MNKAPARRKGWRAVLIEQDVQAIWNKIAAIVRRLRVSEPERLTQEIFLHLIVTGRFQFYLDKGFTGDQIKRDILSLINR
ncbi:MAG TPA: hypothetical protein VNO14_12615 [Blastocatellia bacterium]|nr:hypothetical protein [Blastocatellia bacterium]